MEVIVKTRGVEFGDSLREYVERKASKLDRFFPDIREAEIDLITQKTRSAEESQVAQITLRGNRGLIVRAEERSGDMRSSVDVALDKVERQIKRYKGKHWSSRQRQAEEELEPTAEELEFEEEAQGQIVRVKEFYTRPMDVEEAIEQMELLGHDFFVFYNVNTNNYSVVYRRRGEGYGLLLPELV
jgi:putative sigma-54 modulation protein